jgi:magnesium transporter
LEEIRPQKNEIEEVVRELLQKQDWTVLKTILVDLHPADIAEIVTRMDRDERRQMFSLIETEKIAEVIIELDDPVWKEILEEQDEEKLVAIIKAMDSDDAADIIGELEKDLAARVLDAMPWKESREVETLLRHDEETAGGIMALEIVAVDQEKTAGEALEVLRRKAEEVEDVYNIYAVDGKGVLKGIVSLKDLVLANPKARLNELMDKEPVSIHPEMDQEEVANLFQKYDLVSAPVVDAQERLVGRITVDDVLEVVEEEVNEDFTKMAGITDEEIGERSIFKISRVRLPWLLLAFVGQIVSAKIYEHFVPSTSELIMATFFVPMIMAMAGNIGIQSSTVIIRGLVTGDIRLKDTGWRLLQELSVAFLNGFGIAVLLFTVVSLWFRDTVFGGVLGVAMLAVLTIAALLGTLVPLFLKRIRIDPAIATGPFITTSNDIIGLTIYFTIIRLVL